MRKGWKKNSFGLRDTFLTIFGGKKRKEVRNPVQKLPSSFFDSEHDETRPWWNKYPCSHSFNVYIYFARWLSHVGKILSCVQLVDQAINILTRANLFPPPFTLWLLLSLFWRSNMHTGAKNAKKQWTDEFSFSFPWNSFTAIVLMNFILFYRFTFLNLNIFRIQRFFQFLDEISLASVIRQKFSFTFCNYFVKIAFWQRKILIFVFSDSIWK